MAKAPEYMNLVDGQQSEADIAREAEVKEQQDITITDQDNPYVRLNNAIDGDSFESQEMILQFLDEEGLDINGIQGVNPPLCQAVLHGTPENLEFLLEREPKPNLKVASYTLNRSCRNSVE